MKKTDDRDGGQGGIVARCLQCEAGYFAGKEKDFEAAKEAHLAGCNQRKAAFDLAVAPLLAMLEDGKYYYTSIATEHTYINGVSEGGSLRAQIEEDGFKSARSDRDPWVVVPIEDRYVFRIDMEESHE